MKKAFFLALGLTLVLSSFCQAKINRNFNNSDGSICYSREDRVSGFGYRDYFTLAKYIKPDNSHQYVFSILSSRGDLFGTTATLQVDGVSYGLPHIYRPESPFMMPPVWAYAQYSIPEDVFAKIADFQQEIKIIVSRYGKKDLVDTPNKGICQEFARLYKLEYQDFNNKKTINP